MKRPNPEKLAAQAAQWNLSHPIGTAVTRYKLIAPLREGTETKTRSEAWVMGGHSVMVMVEGVSGGVLLESVRPCLSNAEAPNSITTMKTPTQNAPPAASTDLFEPETPSVFEMVDATDFEQYFPIGVWLTLESAIASLDECEDPDAIGSDGCHDDYAKVEIRKRTIGWSGGGEKVYQREWVQKYDEDRDEYDWHVVTDEASNRNQPE